jgi:hypothetical protein
MPGALTVLMSFVATLATVSFASTNSATGGPRSSPPNRWAPVSSVLSARPVSPDSLYWKLYTSATDIYSSPTAQDVTPAQSTTFTWQSEQSVPCMTPDGQYVFEVYGANMRRTNLLTDSVDVYTLADTSGGACGTDGRYVYVPDGTTTRKYSLTGNLESTTTTDYAPWVGNSTFGFGVANDTVWLTPDMAGATWYGYACSSFTGGSITHDATWATGGGSPDAMSVSYDGHYYYMTFGGWGANTFLRFYRDRTLYSTGTVTGDARSVMCRNNAVFKVLYAGTEGDNSTLRAQIVSAAGDRITTVDYFDARNSALQAHSLYQQGYRVIITFGGNYLWNSGAVFGDSLAEFVDLGGGALNMTFTTCAGGDWCIGGRYKDQYMPVPTVSYGSFFCASITILDPSHPIMAGVTAIDSFTCEPYTTTLRSPYSVRIADWNVTSSYIECAAFDSGGRRTVFLGYHPNYNSGGKGQWLTQLVNALIWMGNPMSTVTVIAPNGGESWVAGTNHNIAWSQDSNVVRDSIYYSTDAGSTWTGVAYYDPPPSPLQHTWTVPSTPTTQARVKVVSWDAGDSMAEDASDSNFTIEPPVSIAQPGNGALPLVFALYQPYPNPLASGTAIRYALPSPAEVDLRIYDVAGALVRRLVDGVQTAGYRSAYWNGFDELGRAVASGVYYCRFRAGNYLTARKLVIRR